MVDEGRKKTILRTKKMGLPRIWGSSIEPGSNETNWDSGVKSTNQHSFNPYFEAVHSYSSSLFHCAATFNAKSRSLTDVFNGSHASYVTPNDTSIRYWRRLIVGMNAGRWSDYKDALTSLIS